MTSIELANNKFKFSPTGLSISGNPTFEEWRSYFTQLILTGESIGLILGDMLNYGFDRWPDEVGQIFDPDNEHPLYKFRTLQNLKYITSRWPASRRREYPGTPITYYQETASLPEPQRENVLKQALENGKGRDWIRQEKRRLKSTSSPTEPKEDYNAMIRAILNAIKVLKAVYPEGIDILREEMETL